MNSTFSDPSQSGASRGAELLRAAARLVFGAVRRPWRRAAPGSDAVLMAGNRNDGPPDLDELWRDFNRKLGGLFGGRRGGGDERGSMPGGRGDFQPDMKGAGIGVGMIIGVVLLIWAGSGVFIVQEGQQAVVTTFGRYARTVDAGFSYRLPFPIEAHELVSYTQTQSTEIGGNNIAPATGLRDSSMLTQDENIVDIRFTVFYRLKDAREFLFENNNVREAVKQAAESAVREIVGRSKMDSVLYEQRDAIAADLVKSVQNQLDRLRAGILVTNVNVQSVQAPEQVQAAFDDAVKAGADRERLKNEGQAYANDVIPRARGAAARLIEEANGHRERVVAAAEGDAQRFRSVLEEYQKAPTVTRDRLYIDAMTQVYANVSKVLVESRSSGNLLYLPLDKLIQQATSASPSAVTAPSSPVDSGSSSSTFSDPRARDSSRSRDRESR